MFHSITHILSAFQLFSVCLGQRTGLLHKSDNTYTTLHTRVSRVHKLCLYWQNNVYCSATVCRPIGLSIRLTSAASVAIMCSRSGIQRPRVLTVRGHPFMTSTKNLGFAPLPMSTCVHMGRTPPPLVDVHTRST